MKVGLFGYYRYGNFGDDLMASLFFDDLRRAGHAARVYGLDRSLAGPAGIETAASIGELAAWADCLVYGGGGVFLDQRANPQVDAELNRFLDARLERGVPLFLISVGGDAQSCIGTLMPGQRRLLREADFITFRNPEDERLASEASVDRYAVYPDVVWTAGRPPSTTPAQRPISIEFSGTRHKALYYAAFALGRALPGREIVDVDLRYRGNAKPTMKREARNRMMGTRSYESIREIATLARQSRYIFTSRLHFGLLGLASGSTTFLVHPSSKARMLFEHHCLSDYVIDRHTRMLEVIRDVLSGAEDTRSLSAEQRRRIEGIREQAQGHFHKLHELLDHSGT